VVIAFLDDHRDRLGVEPICRVLNEHGVPIAPTATTPTVCGRGPRERARNPACSPRSGGVFNDPQLGRGLYGARKVPAQLVREGGVDGVSVSRCHVVKYTNQQLTSAEVIAVELAKEIAAEGRRGAQFTPPLRSTSLPSTTLSASTRRRWA